MSDCEATQEVDDGESPPKKQKKASTGGTSKEIQDLQRQKKAAVKSENYAEALRLKEAIDALQEKMKTEKTTGSAPAAPKGKAGTKRPLEQAEKEKPKPKPPAVEELSADPFFGDQTPALLAPTCATAAEREAWRAVYHGNTDFFQEKIAGKLPLLCQRDMVSKQTALHLAIQKGNAKAIRMFAVHRHENRGSVRMTSMAAQGTGTMNPLALGFETGKVGAARGGKELNNALVDQRENPEPLQEVVARTPLPSDFLQLLMGLDFITQRAYMRRGKIMNLGRGRGDPFACDLMECLEPAMKYGQLGVVQLVLKRLSSMGVGPGHEVAAGLKDMPDNLQARSVTAVLRFGGALTPVHIAAINPDATRLSELLKREPSAAILKNEGGHQPVHFAAACERPEPLRLLLSEWSADRRAIGSVKRTPLHFAAAAGRAENVKALMGGEDLGPGRSLLFTKEIRMVLMRQKANLKIGNDGICILSRLLVDLMSRIVTDSKRRAEQQPKLGLRALHLATKSVLTGTLASVISEKSGKLAGGKLGFPGLASELSRSLSQLGEGELERMFNSVDQDGNGKLDKKEIEAVFQAANMKLQKKQLTNIIKDMDSDGNGDVSLEEFSSWMEAGSTHAIALRRHLVVAAGAMGQADVAEAEAAEETDMMQGIDKLAFDARQFLQLCKFPDSESGDMFEQYVAYSSAVLECACTKVLEVSANSARSQKKTSISPEHILSSIRANEDLQGLYQADSVVMNSLLLQARDKDGCTALHLAAEAGHLACLQVLISCGSDVDAPGPDRKPALAIAGERGHVECVKALVHAKAKIDLADKRKRTPLLLAIRAGQTVVASVLLNRGADPDAADDSGNTVVHYAAAFGWLDCVDLLNRGGAKLSCANAMKLAPITAALQKGHKTVFRRMLDLGIDVNFRDADGTTLLLGCLGTVNRLVHKEIEFMMSKGADPSLASSSGTTPLHALASAKAGDQSSAYVPHPFEEERLRRVSGWAERPKKKEDICLDSDEDEEDEDQQPPAKKAKKADDEVEELHELVHRRGFHQLTDGEREAVFRLGFAEGTWQCGSNPVVTWSSLDEAKQQAARTLGLDESTWAAVPVRIVTGMRGEDGTIPLESGMAVGAGEDGMVNVLVGSKEQSVHVSRVLLPEEDVNQVWSQTPHVTVAIARMFLEKGVAVDARDAQGCTPLMLALRSKYYDLALCLLERGADPNAEAKQEDETATAKAGSLPKPRPRRPIDEVQPGEMSRSMDNQLRLLQELLSKGCKVQDPATEVDASVVLRFIEAGQLKSASLLIDAGADLSADRTGQNALHKIFVQVFAHPAESAKSTKAVSIAMQLLTSETWGTKLLAAWARDHPRVTPLHSLIKAFAARTYSLRPEEKDASDRDMRAELLLKLLDAAPSTVDFSKAYHSSPSQGNVQCPQSLLGLLCASDQPTEKSQALVVKAISLLCRRGVSANASDGSPAALHSLAQRLGPGLAASEFAKVLLPLTDLTAHMPGGLTLLTFMLRGYHSDHGGKDAEVRACLRMLLEGKCDPDAADSPPKPKRATKPLHAAAALRSEGLVSDLLLARADPCGIDNEEQQRTPLHFAVASAPTGSDANFDIEDMLIQAKADPAKQDSLGLSVLHFALAKAEDGSLTQFQGEWLHELQDERERLPRRKSWTKQSWPLICKRVDPIETISSLCVLPGVNVNAKDKKGMSPLHLAVLRGASICALKLISAGATLEELFEGNSPLGLAMHRYPDLAVLLMQKGASTSPKVVLFGSAEISQELHTGEQETIFSLAIRQASVCNQSVRASYLGAAISSMDSGFPREQALTDTIASQQFVMLLTLIPKVGVEVLRDMRSANGQSLLHRVAACRDVKRRGGSAMQQQELLRKILRDGASLQEVQDPFLRGASKLLERGVLLTADSNGRTPLHFAAQNHHVDLVALMLERGSAGAELVRAVDADGRTALGCGLATQLGEPALRIAGELIARGASARQAIVDVEARLPALSWCILQEAPPVVPLSEKSWVQVLFSGEHPDLTILDKDGDSCLTMAACAPRYSLSYLRLVVRWAKAAGGDATRKLLLGQRSDGSTALHLAVCKGNMGFVNALLEQAEQVSRNVLREILQAKDSFGRTALIDAVRCPSASLWMVCLLLRWMDDETAAAVLPMADKEGHTALMYAVKKNDTKLVHTLLAGRPSKPEDLQVKCPDGLMAGSQYMATVYCGGSPSAVKYSSCNWLDAAQPPALITRDADGWHSADVFSDASTPVANGALPNGTEVTWIEADTARLLVKCHLGQVWVRRQDVYSKGASPPAPEQHSKLQYSFKATVPAGVGPGVSFTITSEASAGSPGNPGLAGSFAGEGTPRMPASALGVQSSVGSSALHYCVQPLAFGSYENTEILSALVKGGAPADLKDASGRTAVDLACSQQSGRMLKCLQELGVHGASGRTAGVDRNGGLDAWPDAVDVAADSAKALSDAAEAAERRAGGQPEPPVERFFQKPSQASDVVVARGPDGSPLDLVMTKVDLTRGPMPQNVFYRMQVLHERNQNNYFLFTRWGMIGDSGQHQSTPFESLEKASADFCKIFKSKSGNDWSARASFEKKPLKYQLHDLKYPTVGVQDALQMDSWKRLPTQLTPLPLRRLLNCGSSFQLLRRNLQQAGVEQPLGALKQTSLDEARDTIRKLGDLLSQKSEESGKAEPSGAKLQALHDDIAAATGRLYELVPTKESDDHTRIRPVRNTRDLKQWSNKISETDDLACAARILLGAQSHLAKSSPTDYIFRATGVRVKPLPSESSELRFIEQYINRSSPGECRLFAGEGAEKLPERPKPTPGEKEVPPVWQALEDVICYRDPSCQNASHAGCAVGAGSIIREYETKDGAICIKKRNGEKDPGMWVKPRGADGTETMVKLSDRECASKVAAVYRVDRKGEEARAGGDTAQLLFHGSGMPNMLSILSQGLRVKPPGAQHAGSAFGNGVYFANAFSKSRGYCRFHNGIGYMLLCEVTTGRELTSRDFNFQQAVMKALLQVSRERLGLPADAKLDEHPALKEEYNNIQARARRDDIEDLTGLPYDSFHLLTQASPEEQGRVQHPDGYSVPHGALVARDGSAEPGSGSARDEMVVYDTSRVRLRYVVELRDFTEHIVPVPKPEGAENGPVNGTTGGSDGDNGGQGDEEMDGNDESEDEDADMSNEEDDE